MRTCANAKQICAIQLWLLLRDRRSRNKSTRFSCSLFSFARFKHFWPCSFFCRLLVAYLIFMA